MQRTSSVSLNDSKMLDVNVILCTYNRSQSLAKALESVAASVLPASINWEVMVVDNNSHDQTREVVETFSRRYPGRFRYVFERQQGKSYALNRAIRETRADILAFMDDDVIVEPTWLQNLTAGLHGGIWVGAGGRIVPDWPCSPPSWLPVKEWYGMAPLVMFDLGLEAGRLQDAPFGTNMAFHRSMFEKYGPFRTDLGPRPNSEIRSEDTEFGNRLLAAGEPIRYEPRAVVHHAVPQKRLQKKFFLRWWFDKGRTDIRENRRMKDKLVLGVPLVFLRKVTVGTFRWVLAIQPARRFSYRLTVWFLAGKIVESFRRSAQPSL